jgi:hypothetical protein
VNWKCRRALPIAAALLITLYGGLLRLDAFVGKYPKLDHPGWARVLVDHIAPLGAALRPSSIVWKPEAQPYIGGDPITYLSYARQMRGFFDADVREPVFRALMVHWSRPAGRAARRHRARDGDLGTGRLARRHVHGHRDLRGLGAHPPL